MCTENINEEPKCKDCWYFATKYFCDRDCCTVDEDDDEGTIHWADGNDNICNRFERDLS